MTTPIKVKFAKVDDLTFNFPEEQLKDFQDVAKAVNGAMPPARNWDNEISLEEYRQKCEQQEGDKEIFLYNCNRETLEKIFKASDLKAKRKLANQAALEAIVGGANLLGKQVNEVEDLKQKYLEDFKQELKQNAVDEINKDDLEKWVKDCDKVLLDNILAYFKDEEGLKVSGVATKRKKVVELIYNQDDKDIAALLKFNYVNIGSCHNDIKTTKKEYEETQEVLVKKKKEYNEAKQNLKNRQGYSSDLSEMHFVDADPESKEMLANSKKASNLARAKRKMQSIKRKGLIEVSKGFAMAAVEGTEEAYMATVVEIGNKVIAGTKGAMASHPAQNIDAKSEEQCDAVLSTANLIAKAEIEKYSGEKNTEVGTNAAANSLVIKSKTSSKKGNSQTQKG